MRKTCLLMKMEWKLYYWSCWKLCKLFVYIKYKYYPLSQHEGITFNKNRKRKFWHFSQIWTCQNVLCTLIKFPKQLCNCPVHHHDNLRMTGKCGKTKSVFRNILPQMHFPSTVGVFFPPTHVTAVKTMWSNITYITTTPSRDTLLALSNLNIHIFSWRMRWKRILLIIDDRLK